MKDSEASVLPTLDPLFLDKAGVKFVNQIADYSELKRMLGKYVIEIVFKRRRWPVPFATVGRKSEWRRMLATANWDILGRHKKLFGFVPPKSNKLRTSGWYKRKDLLVCHDFIRKGWRMINAKDYYIVSYFAIETKEQEKTFIEFYKNIIENNSERKLLSMFDR